VEGELSCRDPPDLLNDIPDRNVLSTDREGKSLALSLCELLGLVESSKLLNGLPETGRVLGVELSDLACNDITGVLDVHGDGEELVVERLAILLTQEFLVGSLDRLVIRLVLLRFDDVVVLEGRVTHSVTEFCRGGNGSGLQRVNNRLCDLP
jgi:hypothetical protein